MRGLAIGFLAVMLGVAVPASPRAAPPRISLGAIQAERGTALSSQLASTLCKTFECVPRAQVVTRGKVDLAKMRARNVSGFLFGSVTAKGSKSRLWLALVTTSESPSHAWDLALTNGGILPRGDLQALATELDGRLGGAGSADIPPPARPAAEGPTRAAESSGAPRLALGAIQGDLGSRLSRQLEAELCRTFECVPRSEAATGGKANLGRMRARGVSGFLFGSLATKWGVPTLWLALVTPSKTPAKTWSMPLVGKGLLAASSIDRVVEDLQDLLGAPGPHPGDLAVPPPAPGPAGAPPPVPAAADGAPTGAGVAPAGSGATAAAVASAAAAAPPIPPAEPPPPAAAPAASEPAVEGDRPRGRAPALHAEVGAFLVGRRLSYQGVPAGTPSALYGYQADVVAGPWLQVGFFPAVLLTEDPWLGGIGLFASYGFSVGLETQAPAGGSSASSFQALRTGLLWRVRPVAGSGFALVPLVAYRMQSFTVDPAIAGLPDSNLSGVEGGLGVEVPIGIVTLLAGGGYVKWLGTGDMVSAAYFASGSASALELEGGLSVRLLGPVSLRAVGTYSRTTYTLSQGSSAGYQATGATDQYVGGRLTVRGEL